MEQDIAAKQKQRSKFFTSSTPNTKNAKWTSVDNELPVAGPSRLSSENKENICIVIDNDDETNSEEEVESNVSIVAQGEVGTEMEMELDDPTCHNIVEQEDGYISPTPSCLGDVQDLSSPIVSRHTPMRKQGPHPRDSVDLDFGAEAVSSPSSQVKSKRRRLSDSTPRQVHRTRSLDLPLSGHATRRPGAQSLPTAPSASFPGVDLRHSFSDDRTSDIDCSDDEMRNLSGSNSPPTPTPSPLMPVVQEDVSEPRTDNDVRISPKDNEARANEMRKQAVITGWKERWALNKDGISGRTTPRLQRRETNVTPAGRHTLNNARTRQRPHPPTAPNSVILRTEVSIKPRRVQPRKSLPFLEPPRKEGAEVIDLANDSDDGHHPEPVLHTAKLEQFR
jgi:hypothetical protein